MAIYKCKMCGGSLEVLDGGTVCECEYCGSMQTIPTNNDDSIRTLYNRANTLRMKSDFDKAEELFEKILQLNSAEAEAYWGLILCKYGVEYVEDPGTLKRIPTCHRTSYDAITADEDYKNALRYGSVQQQMMYEAEARAIDEIQKGILSISRKEQPYDVFICYKETDESGRRTQDSVIANDIYYQLTQAGFRVFYAAITLEDKLGSEYEPCIFSALNSAKVMLVIGTRPEYFNAVWVKNEWSRYLQIMKKDRSKLLIPCFRDMDAYELPEEFAHLQAQDMAKIGFINDVVRGIRKLMGKEEPAVAAAAPASGVTPLLKRAAMFLEDGDWKRADEFCEEVLNIDPENAQAYLYKLMANTRTHTMAQLEDCSEPFDGNANYKKVMRFGDQALHDTLQSFNKNIRQRNENARKDSIYQDGLRALARAKTELEFLAAARLFRSIPGWLDADEKADEAWEKSKAAKAQAREKAETERKNKILRDARSLAQKNHSDALAQAIELLNSIPGWQDADSLLEVSRRNLEEVLEREAREKRERERMARLHQMYDSKYKALLDKRPRLEVRLKEATQELNNAQNTSGSSILLIWGIVQSLLGAICIAIDATGVGVLNLVIGLLVLALGIKIITSVHSKKRTAIRTLTPEIDSINQQLAEIRAIPSFEDFERAAEGSHAE